MRPNTSSTYQYQFAHLCLMEFSVSVYAHFYLSPAEVTSKKKLRSCLPMICSLANENKRCFVRLLPNMKSSKEENKNFFSFEISCYILSMMSLSMMFVLFKGLKLKINKRINNGYQKHVIFNI